MKNYKCERCDRRKNIHPMKSKPSRPHLQEEIAHFGELYFQNKNQLIEHMWSPQHRSLLPFTSESSISRKVVIYRMS